MHALLESRHSLSAPILFKGEHVFGQWSEGSDECWLHHQAGGFFLE
jgi:hypothetical protein